MPSQSSIAEKASHLWRSSIDNLKRTAIQAHPPHKVSITVQNLKSAVKSYRKPTKQEHDTIPTIIADAVDNLTRENSIDLDTTMDERKSSGVGERKSSEMNERTNGGMDEQTSTAGTDPILPQISLDPSFSMDLLMDDMSKDVQGLLD